MIVMTGKEENVLYVAHSAGRPVLSEKFALHEKCVQELGLCIRVLYFTTARTLRMQWMAGFDDDF
jgi:hypothetical protein